MGWLKRVHEQKQELSLMGLVPSYETFMNWGNDNDDEAGLPKIWKINGEKNLPYLDSIKDKVQSVYSMPKYEKKVLVAVGMGASLREQIDDLRGLSDRYILACTNSSCEYLLSHGIVPHYVVLLDGRPGNWTLNLGEQVKNVTAIFSPSAEPEAIRSWPGKMMIVPLGVKDKSLNRKIERRWGKPLPAGGNAFNSIVSIFHMLTDIKIMMFVGNDLSFKKTYYGDGRKSGNDDSAYFFCMNARGEKVRTLIPLFEYKIWLETVMEQTYPEYFYMDCSGGILGLDVDGEVMPYCQHMPVREALAEIEEAFRVEESDLNYKLKYLYDQFYDHDLGNQQRGVGVWKHIVEHYEFKKGLDVGCGRANGVQWARENGYDVYGCDISSSAVKCWKERGVKKYCKVAPADKIPFQDNYFDFVVCSEVMEHIPEEDTEKTLREILRVGSDKFLFTICMIPEKIPVASLIQSHINLHNPKWWVDMFTKCGYEISGVATNEVNSDLSIMAVKDASPYIAGEKQMLKNPDAAGCIPVVGYVVEVPDTPEYAL